MFATVRTALAATVALGLTTTLAVTASAQSGPPGACDCDAPPPVVLVAPAPAPALPRWGIGLRLGGLSLAPAERPEATTDYAVGGVQVRYRVRPRWQLELSMDHATEQLEDGTEGDRELQAVTFAALYHLSPYARWDWYLLAGLGATTDGAPDLDPELRRASEQGHVHVGVGVERRWDHLALSAELRLVGMAQAEDDGHGAVTASPAMTRPGEAPAARDMGTSGAQFSLGAGYYF